MSQTKSPSTVIINELSRIRTTLAQMEQEESASKQAFQTLYSEMEFYKENCMQKIENLLLQDLLRFYDSLSWFRQTLNLPEDTEAEKTEDVIDNFSIVFEEFTDLLQDRSITLLPSKTNFDASLHRVVEIVSTDQEELHNTIKSVVKKGFQRQDQILRFEEVVIYQLNN